jgi:hypothetical protein
MLKEPVAIAILQELYFPGGNLSRADSGIWIATHFGDIKAA